MTKFYKTTFYSSRASFHSNSLYGKKRKTKITHYIYANLLKILSCDMSLLSNQRTVVYETQSIHHIHIYYKLVVIFIHLYMEKYKFVSSYMCDSEGNCVILYIIIKYLRYIGIHVCCLGSYENATTHLDCVRATAAIFCTQKQMNLLRLLFFTHVHTHTRQIAFSNFLK